MFQNLTTFLFVNCDSELLFYVMQSKTINRKVLRLNKSLDMKMTNLRFLTSLFLVPIFVGMLTHNVLAVDENQDHTAKIQILREQIKIKIYPNNSLVYNYINDDAYIQKWLQKNHFDIEKTRHDFMKHLQWRHKENIDIIEKEDWTFYKSEYPQFFDTVDKYGRPVAEIWLSDWNVRRAIIMGQKNKLIRWSIYLVEMMERRLYQIRNDKKLRNVTTGVEIIDLEGFNRIQHGCFNCPTVYTGLAIICGEHYPGIWRSVHMVNVGPAFKMLLHVGRDFNYAQKNITRLYSHRKEWLPVLDKEISKDQRSIRLGGIIERSKQ